MASNSQKKKKKKNDEYVEFCSGNYALLPIIAVIFFVTILMRAYVYEPNMGDAIWFPLNHTSVDIFLFYKGVVSAVLAGVMVVILVTMGVVKKEHLVDFKKDIFIYPLAGFGLLALISTLASPNRYFGFHGIYEQFESIWVILAYCIFTIFSYIVVTRSDDLRVIRKALAYLLIFLSIIGFTQLIGKDFFESETGRTIIVPDRIWELRENLSFNFSGSGNHQVYLTLYNPNYVGLFVSFILPITVALAISAKTVLKKVLWALLSVSMFVCVLGSGSKTFILSLGAVVIVALVMFRKQILKAWPIVLASIVIVGGSGALYFKYIGVNVVDYMVKALTTEKNDYALTDVEVGPDNVEFTYNDGKLYLSWAEVDNGTDNKGYYVIFCDENGSVIPFEAREDGYYLLDDRYDNVSYRVVKIDEPYNSEVMVSFGSIDKFLSFVQDETGYHYYNIAGHVDEIVNAPSAIFTNVDGMASGRGYIWSRTIPVMMKHFFIGTGADTFSLAFPHNDYLGRMNSGYGRLIITKPHCMYLQMGTQLGVVALLCFIAVALIYLIDSVKLYWHFDIKNADEVFGLGVALGVLGYLVSGIANDSCVATAPIFWIFLGIGFAVNRLNRKEQDAMKAKGLKNA